MILPILSAVGGLASSANQSAPTSLETQLTSKNESAWGSSFAVGSGAKAESTPTLSTGNAGLSIKPEHVIAGGILAAALVVALILRK